MNPVNGGKTQDLAEWMRQSNVNPDNAGVGPALVAKEIDDEISWQVQLIKEYLVKQVQKRDRNDKAAQGKIEGLFGSLNAKECKFLLRFLNNCIDRKVIFETLGSKDLNKSTKKEKLLPYIKIALAKALSLANDSDVKTYQTILNKIVPIEVQHDKGGTVNIKNMALVFGDSFIHASGFEGDVNSVPYAYLAAGCLKKMDLNLQLQNILLDGISLRSEKTLPARKLKAELMKKIEKNGACLIYGGWRDHSIVYEFEKQKDGKYTFRIYNEGAGTEFHRRTTKDRRDKVDGCIALKDISETALISDSFIACLQSLCPMESKEGPAELLIGFFLPLLGGVAETIPPGVQSELSLQRSGTCTYKSLLACVANHLSEYDYKLFKVELKLFLMDEYLPTLKTEAKAKITEYAYDDARRNYALIKRSIEKFAASLAKPKNRNLPVSIFTRAQDKILQYKQVLKVYEDRILDFEKTQMHSKGKIDELDSSMGTYLMGIVGPWVYKDQDLSSMGARHLSDFLGKNCVDLIKAIDNLPPAFDIKFCPAFEIILRDIKMEKNNTKTKYGEDQYVLDLLLRKLGSFNQWQKINFASPSEAFNRLEFIVEGLINKINEGSLAEDYARLFSFMHGMEIAYAQMSQKENMILPTFNFSLISAASINQLSELQCSDPFWVEHIKQLNELPNRPLAFRGIQFDSNMSWDQQGQGISLDFAICDAVYNWFQKNIPLKEKVTQSIEKQRIKQKKFIEDEIAEQKNRIAIEQKRIDGQGCVDYEEKKLLVELSEEIDAIPGQVRDNPKWWPWGFREPCDEEPYATRSVEFKGAFLYAKQSFFEKLIDGKSDLLPPEFRKLMDVGAICHNIFSKKESFSDECISCPTKLVWTYQTPNILHFIPTMSSKFSSACQRTNRYIDSIPNESCKLIYRQNPVQTMKGYSESTAPRETASLAGVVKSTEIGRDDVLEILSLASSPWILIDSLLIYYNENRKDLSDASWFNLFHSLLFNGNFLLRALGDLQQRDILVSKFRRFFNVIIENAIELNDFSTAANVAWMAKNVQTYLDHVMEKEAGAKKIEPIIAVTTLTRIFEKGTVAKFGIHKPVLFEAMTACCKDLFLKGPQTDDEKKLFAYGCIANSFRLLNPPGNKSWCIPRSEDAMNAMANLRNTLSKLDINDGLKRTIDKSLRIYGAYIMKIMFPLMKNACLLASHLIDEYSIIDGLTGQFYGYIYLSSGTFVPKNDVVFRIFDKPLPYDVIRILQEQNVFVKVAKIDFDKFRCCIARDNVIHIQDVESKLELRVSLQDGSVYVLTEVFLQNQPQKLWLHHIPFSLDFRKSLFCNKYLHRNYENIYFLCDKQTHKPVYQGSQVKDSISFELSSSVSPKLIVVHSYQDTFFSSFEKSGNTVFLADPEGEIQQIRFPRLSLTLQKKGNEWECVEQSGWKLAPAEEQFVPHFGPKMGFLVLKYEDKKKKVLLPLWNCIAPLREDKNYSLHFSYDYYFSDELKQHFVECDLIGNKVIPKTIQARFHLARIYIQTGNIDEAEELLFAVEAASTHKKLSENELAILEEISLLTFGDIGSRTLRIRLRALYLMFKNKVQFSPSKQNIYLCLSHYNGLVNDYISRLNHIEPIDPVEELFLLRLMQGQKIAKRITELAPQDEGFAASVKMGGYVDNPKLNYFDDVRNKVSFTMALEPVHEKLYDEARKDKTFPFDIIHATWDQVQPYGLLMQMEVEELTLELDFVQFQKKGFESGFIQGILAMALQGNGDPKKFAQNLCREVFRHDRIKTILRQRAEPRIRVIGPAVPGLPEISLADAGAILRDLPTLINVQATENEGEFLDQLAVQTFEIREKPMVEQLEGEAPFLSKNSPEIKDETTKVKFEQTRKDIDAAKKMMKGTTYTLKAGKDMGAFKETCEVELKTAKKKMALMEQTITQSVSMTLASDPISYLQFASKNRKGPSIAELCIVCAKKGDFAEKLYPELSLEGLSQLKAAIMQYLVQKQFVQHLERTIVQVDTVLEGGGADRALINEMGRNLQAKCQYSLDDPNAMVFLYIETVLNIKLRENQVINIQKFIDGVNGNKEVVLQSIMGSGKTSILQPILAFLFARTDTLSVVDVPESLLAIVVEALKEVLGEAFHQFVYTMSYDRESAKNEDFLKNYYQTILEAQSRGACYLRTPRTKDSIIASLYEAYYDQIKGVKGAEQRIDLISKIVSFLQIKEVVQVDEIDSSMNSKVIFKFPVGSSSPVDNGKASIISNLLLDAVLDPEIIRAVSLEFGEAFQKRVDPNYIKKGASLTPQLFKDVIRPRLGELALTRLREQIDGFNVLEQKDEQGYLGYFVTQTSPYDLEIEQKLTKEEEVNISKIIDSSINYPTDSKEWLVAQKMGFTNRVNRWIKQMITKPADRELIGAVADAIKNILPESMSKICGTNYGIDLDKEGIYVARPYLASKAMKVSVYSDPLEQLIYSTQMVLNYGIPKDAAIVMLKDLQLRAKEEVREGIALSDSDAYKEFKEILGIVGDNFQLLEDPPSENLINAFSKYCSINRNCIFDFLQSMVFRQIKVFSESISSTPQSFAGSSKCVCGYTGTLNPGILSRTAEPLPEVGTDGQTILAIQHKMKSGEAETLVFNEKKGKFTDQIIDKMVQGNDEEIFVFIDSGGWLRDETILEFAERLFKACKINRPEIKGIVYHNEKGELVSLEPEQMGSDKLIEVPLALSNYKTAEGEQLTIIAQRYETGTDIKQKPTAKAFTSIRKEMTKRDGLQSVFRMRQILFDQTVSFVMTDEIKDYIAAGILGGLLSRPQFKALFSSNKIVAPEQFNLAVVGIELSDKLRAELMEVLGKYNSQPISIMPKVRISAFSKLFSDKFCPDSEDVWRYMITNEALVEQTKNWEAGKQRMSEVIGKPLRMLLSDLTLSLDVRTSAFTHFKNFLIEKANDSSFDKMTAESIVVDAENAIEIEKAKYQNMYDEMLKTAPNKVIEAYNRNVIIIRDNEKMGQLDPRSVIASQLNDCIDKTNIPNFIEISNNPVGSELQLMLEKEARDQVQNERQIEIEKVLSNIENKNYKHLCKFYTFYKPIDLFGTAFNKLSVVLPLPTLSLPDKMRIEYSPNLFIDNAKINTPQHAAYRIPGRYILVLKNPGGCPEIRYVMVSTKDAQYIKQGILINEGILRKGSEVSLIDYDRNLIVSNMKSPLSINDSSELKRICVQAKLCTGKTNFSKEDISIIEAMCEKSRVRIEELHIFVRDTLRFMPAAAARFHGSTLQKFFLGYQKL